MIKEIKTAWMRIFVITVLVLLQIKCAQGQLQIPADSTILYFGNQLHYGFIIPHASAIGPLVRGTNPWGAAAEVSRLRYTQSAWDACNCYSKNGVSLTYFNFNSSQVLGSSVSLAVFAEPQMRYGAFNIGLRAGLGLSYLTRVYHPESNPDNIFFSRPLSGLIFLQWNNSIWLNDSWAIRLSAAYHHISNGGSRQPNLGMNFPTLSVGVDYSMGRVNLRARPKKVMNTKSIQYYGSLFFTTRSVSSEEGTRKPVLGITAGFYKPIARMHGVGIATELVNDWSIKERSRQSADVFDHRIVSGLLSHHFLFGKFDFSQALGVYLYKQYPSRHTVFQRYALQYRLSKNIQVGFSLKAHLQVAEQMDVRISYLF